MPLAAEDDEAAVRQQRHLESLPSAALRAARLLLHSMVPSSLQSLVLK